MNVLSITPECYPLVKTGGLADVAGALPLALGAMGVQTRVLLPSYPGVREQLLDTRQVAALPGLFGGDGALVTGTSADGLQVLLVEAPHLYDREGGGPYQAADGSDWPDNHLRFGALSWVGAQLSLGRLGQWRPELVHLHDWPAALTAAYLRAATRPPRPRSPHAAASPAAAPASQGAARPATLLTVHNLAFQGVFPTDLAAALKLPAAVLGYDGLEYWGKLSFLKAAVQWCDHINTVSPTYAREIVTPEQGMGFDGLLRLRGDALTGIVNGIDDTVWNPTTDRHIASHYSARRLEAKAANKAALQVELGLDVRVDTPLFCVVSRLTTQKGIDLLLAAMHALYARDAQLAVLGIGDRDLQDALRREAERHPRQVSVTIGFDEPLSHRLQAGADAIAVPSRFEPCGLTQLYGLRYGTLPVVARVGGLADTVIDANEAALRDGVATGFQFSPIDATQLAVAIDRACLLFADRLAWQRVQRRAMTRDVGWGTAALTYFDLYQRLIAGT